jgi:ABC-type transport system involved in cytochrome c biogenesis permease subunit
VEKEFLRLYANLAAYAQLTFSFQFALPHPDFAVSNAAVRARLQVPEDGPLSFLDVYQRAQGFSQEMQALAATKPETWNDEQAELFRLSSALFQWSQFYRGLPITLLPMEAHGQEQWVSPWDLLGFGFLNDASRREIGWLQDLARAYVAGRQVDFDLAAHNIERSVVARAQPSRGLMHLETELLYNRLQPFYRAKWFYGLAFLVCLVGMMGRGGQGIGERCSVTSDRTLVTGHRSPSFMRRAAVVGVLLALIPHTTGIVWRMMIMGRPPMTNLYATFLFVAWIAVLLGLAIEWFQRNSLGTLLASAGGLALLMVSARFADQGDTMGVVVAVLDSNFWLSTHVVTITMGYAGCMAAGLAGHVYLLQAIRRAEDDPGLRATEGAVYGLTAFGLIFSFLGTMLGGVWADQSWGRFWGWDPKENGALLIVLWCSILFHARVARMIGPRGFAVGAVLGVIVVLMAWIGINLLGVGLHSYGFTSGLARGLALSIVFEVLFVLVTYPLGKRGGDVRAGP